MTRADARRVERLVAWFARHARDLPWRRRRTGYNALVAETMLQQTQVDRVVDAYEAFLERFPTVAALAAADEQEVLAAWRGLGYYRRARHLHAAARRIVEDHAGRVPRDAETLRTLPGVGRYTAGAIASIVHGHATPIVDGNVQRVIARWDAHDAPGGDPATVRRTWERAAELVDIAADPGALNEALMELGALVCTPRTPRCHACPVSGDCRALREGRQDAIPRPKPVTRRKIVHHHAVVVVRGDRVLLEQRDGTGLWAGMWQPPTVEAETPLRAADVDRVLRERGMAVTRLEPAGSMPFQTTHRSITFHLYAGVTRMRRGRWEDVAAIEHVPMSNAHRRVIERVGGLRPEA